VDVLRLSKDISFAALHKTGPTKFMAWSHFRVDGIG